MKSRPFLNRVLIRRTTVKEKMNTKLIIPPTAEKRNAPCDGILLECGSTATEDIRKHIGKKVIFAQYSGAWIEVNKEERFICNDEDILYLVEDENV